jgi:putative transcription factor
MGNCEICGKRFENLTKAVVEGVMVDVCNECSRYGKVVPVRKPLIEPKRVINVKTQSVYEDIIDDYSSVIKNAREKKGLKQEELAKNVAEKESVIHKIENNSMKPTIKLAKKLEQFLGINLTEEVEEKKDVNLNLKDSGLTIGDLLNLGNRKA